MNKRTFFLLTCSFLFLTLSAQTTYRIKGKPVNDHDVLGQQRLWTLAPGKTYLFRPGLENYGKVEPKLEYSLSTHDSGISIIPSEQHPGYFELTASGPSRKFQLYFHVSGKEKIVVKHALPLNGDRSLPVQTEKGAWIHKNIDWYNITYSPDDRVLMDNIAFKVGD